MQEQKIKKWHPWNPRLYSVCCNHTAVHVTLKSIVLLGSTSDFWGLEGQRSDALHIAGAAMHVDCHSPEDSMCTASPKLMHLYVQGLWQTGTSTAVYQPDDSIRSNWCWT